MGRTKRIRKRKRSNDVECTSSAEIISLMKWMGSFSWKNTSKIGCRVFEQTGRGVTSRKNLCSNDVLISVPFDLLITYSTLSASEDFMRIFKSNVKLSIHDVMAAFLVLERHKKDQSFWKCYLDSLPIVAPKLPWFSSLEEIGYFPEELREKCERCRNMFEHSWGRLKESLLMCLECECCGKKIGQIFDLESYIWGYVMVNTRGVYIDPLVVRKFSNCNIIYDNPEIAMFPLMDMFNHSDVAENEVKFKDTPEGLFYQLSTFNKYKKHDQIFISYGRHDNTKLFSEYGFYLPKNSNDKIKFSSSEILKCLNLKLDSFQFDFLKKHGFLDEEEIFISSNGPSFKLKGFLFVTLNAEVRNYSAFIFSEAYPKTFFQSLHHCVTQLLILKKQEFETNYLRFRNKFEANVAVWKFLLQRVEFVENLRKEINLSI